MRTGLSDLYAGAVEAAIGQDPERAAKLYEHARDVIQPERQAAVERRIERAREERRVTEIVGGLADMPDDPARRPDPDEYQARAAEATPPDASPEVRAQVTRMARIEQARADRAWQVARGRAATSALDWMGENPARPLMEMPTALRDGLSPEQTEALDRTAMNGGRVVTDRDLYDRLDDLAVRTPEDFAGLDLTQHRLSLGDSDYNRLGKLQQALADGKPDPAFERHRLGRLFLAEGLRKANIDPAGPEVRHMRQRLDTLLGAFEVVEGRPPTMADIRGLVSDVLPRAEGDPAEAPPLEAVDAASPPQPSNEAVAAESTGTDPIEAIPPTPPEPEVTQFDDGTRLVTRRGVDTERGKADVTEAYDEQHRIISTDANFADGYRVESRRSYPVEGHWSQVDTVRDSDGNTLGTITTTFDGERATRTVEPTDGAPQTDIRDKDGPVATAQNVSPALAIPFLLEFAAIGVAIIGKAIGDTIARQGTAGVFSGSEMAGPTNGKAGTGHNGPPEPIDEEQPVDKGKSSPWPPFGAPVPPTILREDEHKAPAVVSPGIPPPEGPNHKKLHAIASWLADKHLQAGTGKYPGADGIDTAIGVRLDPRVGEPAAGRDYLPDHPSHRKGLEGEYGLANDIARHFPDHTVIDFGRKAGQRGPDVISVDRDGEIHFWDSKWRSSDISISPSGRAHQTKQSFEGAREHAECSIQAAMTSGHLSPEAGAKALKNLKSGNMTIVTVGTGSARKGVVEQIVGGERAVVYPERRP